MPYLFAIIVGLAGACVGWIAGGFVSPYVAPWIALTDVPFIGTLLRFAGAREILASVGLVAGTLAALRLYGGYRSKPALFGRALVSLIVCGALIYGVREAGSALGVNPLAPVVEFEIRLPAGSAAPAVRDDIQIELHTDRNQIIAALTGVSRDGDRPILRGSAPLMFRTTQRMIIMSLPGEATHVFRLRLPAQPSPSADFGSWQQVDFLEDVSQPARRADVTADYAIRYRVR